MRRHGGRRRAGWGCRRGLATGEALVLAMSVVVIGGLSVAIVPRALEGGMLRGGAPVAIEPPGEAERAVYERVRALFASSVGIVGWWEGGAHGGVEIALWQRDVREAGVVNSDEVVLLSFSRVLGGLSAYVEGTGAPALEGVKVEGEPEPTRGVWLRRVDMLRSDFPEWWRDRPGIERHVIAGGLSDVRIAPQGEAKGLETLRVVLVWGGGTSDGGVEKGAFEVALRRLDVGS